jgi:hypothetical protein
VEFNTLNEAAYNGVFLRHRMLSEQFSTITRIDVLIGNEFNRREMEEAMNERCRKVLNYTEERRSRHRSRSKCNKQYTPRGGARLTPRDARLGEEGLRAGGSSEKRDAVMSPESTTAPPPPVASVPSTISTGASVPKAAPKAAPPPFTPGSETTVIAAEGGTPALVLVGGGTGTLTMMTRPLTMTETKEISTDGAFPTIPTTQNQEVFFRLSR